MSKSGLTSAERLQANEKRWAAMREQTAAAHRAERIAKGLPVTPQATDAERKRFMRPLGDATLNHGMVTAGETVLRRALDAVLMASRDPNEPPSAALDLPQLAIDVYKAMLLKSMRIDRHGRKYK